MDEFKQLKRLANTTEDTKKQTEYRLKMGELVTEMADNGLKPRLLFGKGDVKGQRQRYKERVKNEQRFKCKLCNKVLAHSSSLKHHMDKQVCVINQEERDKIYKEKQKIYREKNKDAIKETQKIYREQHAEEQKIYQKEYRDNEEQKNYQKIYKEQNKDKIKQQRKERYERDKLKKEQSR